MLSKFLVMHVGMSMQEETYDPNSLAYDENAFFNTTDFNDFDFTGLSDDLTNLTDTLGNLTDAFGDLDTTFGDMGGYGGDTYGYGTDDNGYFTDTLNAQLYDID